MSEPRGRHTVGPVPRERVLELHEDLDEAQRAGGRVRAVCLALCLLLPRFPCTVGFTVLD